MEYSIVGTPLPAVICRLNAGETMISEAGGMSWRSDGIEMATEGGGIGKAFGRAFAGETMFTNRYYAQRNGVEIAFASSFPGSIIDVRIETVGALIVQKSAFLASEASVSRETFFNPGIKRGFFGGEGFIMQKISGSGMVFLEIDGSVVKKDLAPGEVLYIDTGYLAAMTPSVSYEVEAVKGMKNKLLGGEGLFNTKIVGPGSVWLQSMPAARMAGAIAPFLPSTNN